MPSRYETPAGKKKPDYVDYDLSPPKLPRKKRRSFDEAMNAILRDFTELEVEWEEEKLVWWKKRKDGKKGKLPPRFSRILLFLYSRNFKKHVDKTNRKEAVLKMLEAGPIQKAILQVIACNGDKCLSSDEHFQAHYIRVCLTIVRYFERNGARGFAPDMSTVMYFLRMQKFGSCFLQAACVAMSYFLQTCGVAVPPPNASRLIRHHFDDEQLIKYVGDKGGDSVGIFQILEEKFFECDVPNRDPTRILCSSLGRESWMRVATESLEQAPGLVSKFLVPPNFRCSPPSNDLKGKFPRLATYDEWGEIPAQLIPPGVARFKTWGELAEFIPFDAPSDDGGLEKENELMEKWKAMLCQVPEDVDDGLTAVTASMSADSGNHGCRETPSERSTAGASMFMYDDSDGEDSSISWDDGQDDSSSASSENSEPGEGAEEAPIHAMVLLGYYIEDGVRYWLLQNSWEGPTQIIEVSTEYFIKSGAFLYFYEHATWTPKDEPELKTQTSGFFCLSPVAESSQLERGDCENWSDALVHPVPEQTQVKDLEDILDEWDFS